MASWANIALTISYRAERNRAARESGSHYQVGNRRVTIWEIYPIMKIDVFQSGAWVDLDAMP
ncbi:MAG: hypothetical protein DMG25_15230 [Acidobacteria bacterium]|nr:MAG: hypothetical protein DMG25_15230 [Acidobacteriota bacterium]